MEELKLLLEQRLMIRRMKSEVLPQLPSKQRKMVILDPNLVKSKSNITLDGKHNEKMKEFDEIENFFEKIVL